LFVPPLPALYRHDVDRWFWVRRVEEVFELVRLELVDAVLPVMGNGSVCGKIDDRCIG
jgi:hypothetical protein